MHIAYLLTLLLSFTNLILAEEQVLLDGHVEITNASEYLKKPLEGYGIGSQPPINRQNEYNYCNMPHVNSKTYQKVSTEKFELIYVELIHRHHKRTPYAANLLPTDIVEDYYHYPQITTGGKIDSLKHGIDLYGVYHGLLDFIPEEYNEDLIGFRVTNNNITTAVFNSLIKGYGYEDVEPELRKVDNLEPNLPCSQADTIKKSIRSTDVWYDELNLTIYSELSEIFGINSTNSPSFFNSIDHFYDNLSSKKCSGDQVNVTEGQLETVLKLGNWEYDYTFRAHPNATEYGKYKYGNFTLELVDHFNEVIDGERSIKYQHNIAHDGSIAGLTALTKGFLNLKKFYWPGMGSEYVFELYKLKTSDDDYSLRILYGGEELSFTPLDDFIDYLNSIDTLDASISCSA